jgi:hypothetical protein
MPFHSDRQLAAACRALCAQVGLERLWTREGPTLEARMLRDTDGGSLGDAQRCMLLAAWAFWDGDRRLRLIDLLESLDGPLFMTIASLVVATRGGGPEIDRWLRANDPTAIPAPVITRPS